MEAIYGRSLFRLSLEYKIGKIEIFGFPVVQVEFFFQILDEFFGFSAGRYRNYAASPTKIIKMTLNNIFNSMTFNYIYFFKRLDIKTRERKKMMNVKSKKMRKGDRRTKLKCM